MVYQYWPVGATRFCVCILQLGTIVTHATGTCTQNFDPKQKYITRSTTYFTGTFPHRDIFGVDCAFLQYYYALYYSTRKKRGSKR